VRAGWVAALAVLVSSSLVASSSGDAIADGVVRSTAAGGARARPRLEASGFLGYGSFGDSELGNSWAPDQAPRASALFGARLGWLAAPELVRRGPLTLSLTFETELSLATSSTGRSSSGDGRMSYFAPVFGWRAHALVRQPLGAQRRLALHAVLGAGGATVASSSPFMAKETDPVAYAGLGATYTLSGRWQLRLDGRQGVMPGRTSSATRVGELQLGLVTAFGLVSRPPPPPPPKPDLPEPPRAAVDDTDADGDGLPDRLDRCPRDKESVNGVADEDGCPESDPDADGVVGAADRCPMEAEDLDHFQDGDGCPERDNDGDGLEDVRDVCPGEPETRNGYADGDGCPDAVPEGMTRALAGAAAVRFERGRARVTPAARRTLQPVLSLLETDGDLAIAIVGTPERAGGEELAKRRAEAVKWYFVDQGIAEDRIDTSVGPAGGPSPIAVKVR